MHWKLDLDRPITNTIRTLENAGVVVTFFSGTSAKIDAFSRARRGSRPVVVLSDAKGSTSRTRFDTYGGCGGNDNRFDTLEACQAGCPEIDNDD